MTKGRQTGVFFCGSGWDEKPAIPKPCAKEKIPSIRSFNEGYPPPGHFDKLSVSLEKTKELFRKIANNRILIWQCKVISILHNSVNLFTLLANFEFLNFKQLSTTINMCII